MHKDIAALPGFVRMELGRGDPSALELAYRGFAGLCLAEGARAAVVVSGPGDPTTPMSLRAALIAIRRQGIRPGFKLAMVAKTAAVQRIYRVAESDAASGGINVRVFWSEYEASAWVLGARILKAQR